MKPFMLNLKQIALALLVIFSVSCSPEDGEQGPPGEDGNANVQTITFDASSFDGTASYVEIPELTEDVLANDAVLTYLLMHTSSEDIWFQVPCPVDLWGFDYAVDVNMSVGYIWFDYADGNGDSTSITAGDLQSGKVIIIESSSTTSARTSNTKQQVYAELKQAGVDINDYYAVCEYYSIKP
ncbi:hypothetical protein [Mangrovimonas spongiae]|uniref:Collagen-like protein n=1 Tax=Mangrovimonas spongiae TaxID=2494697 RepID=A0A3R9MBV7_9FLAO|nr:hypothetical protein [Mangrovimonas spongiae]RSK42123.1 hypothetical protein EJA19_04360 [Mangrovimonas spongiae]